MEKKPSSNFIGVFDHFSQTDEVTKGKSKHDGGIYCLNCLHSFRTNKLLMDIKSFTTKLGE